MEDGVMLFMLQIINYEVVPKLEKQLQKVY
jgi:hypothetical protein